MASSICSKADISTVQELRRRFRLGGKKRDGLAFPLFSSFLQNMSFRDLPDCFLKLLFLHHQEHVQVHIRTTGHRSIPKIVDLVIKQMTIFIKFHFYHINYLQEYHLNTIILKILHQLISSCNITL